MQVSTIVPGDLVRLIPSIEKVVLRKKPTYGHHESSAFVADASLVFLVIQTVTIHHKVLYKNKDREHLFVVCDHGTGWSDTAWFEKA